MNDAPAVPAPQPKQSSAGPLIIILLILLVVFGGGYFYMQKQEADKQAAANQAESDARIQQQVQLDAIKEVAMLHGVAVKGMMKYEVLKSMGQPEETERTSSVAEESRRSALLKLGTFEILHYYNKDLQVLLDVNGTVVLVTGYKK